MAVLRIISYLFVFDTKSTVSADLVVVTPFYHSDHGLEFQESLRRLPGVHTGISSQVVLLRVRNHNEELESRR